MGMIEFINEFNRYNLEHGDMFGTKYVAVTSSVDSIEIFDYEDSDFRAVMKISVNPYFVVYTTVYYDGFASDSSEDKYYGGYMGSLVEYVTSKLNYLTRNLLHMVNKR